MSEGEITRVVVEGGGLGGWWVREEADSLPWFIDLWEGVHQMESHIYFSVVHMYSVSQPDHPLSIQRAIISALFVPCMVVAVGGGNRAILLCQLIQTIILPTPQQPLASW